MKIALVSVVLAGMALCGCSTDSASRVAYGAVQNMKERECLHKDTPDCQKRESYDDYQRRRGELESTKN